MYSTDAPLLSHATLTLYVLDVLLSKYVYVFLNGHFRLLWVTNTISVNKIIVPGKKLCLVPPYIMY